MQAVGAANGRGREIIPIVLCAEEEYEKVKHNFVDCYHLLVTSDSKGVEEAAELLDKKLRYNLESAELYEKLKADFNAKYVENGMLTVVTQTSCLVALNFGLLDGEVRENVIRALEKKIVDNDYTLSTGFIGTGILNQTLSSVGLDNLGYSLLLQTRDDEEAGVGSKLEEFQGRRMAGRRVVRGRRQPPWPGPP